MEDWELLDAWRTGDRNAGQALVSRCLGILTRFFYNKVSDPDDVAELVSETIFACVKNKEQVNTPESFRGFLFATAMNVLYRYYRKKAKRRRELADFEDICVGEAAHFRSPAARFEMQQQSRLLVRALRRVSLDQQIVLELSYIEQLSGQQIAALLQVPAQTVYTRLRRGKERLRTIIGELATTPELAESTLMGLETWAQRVRGQIER